MTTTRWDYLGIGRLAGGLAAILVFAASWLYCISEYGFLVGVTLGWIPASIAAVVIGWLIMLLWGPLIAVGLMIWLGVGSGEKAPPPDADWEIVSEVDAATEAAAAAAAADAAATAALAEAAADTSPAPTVEPYEPQRFVAAGSYEYWHGSDECTDDCSGHEAGYEWAANEGIEDVADCGGNSNSFIEGCEAYVEDNY